MFLELSRPIIKKKKGESLEIVNAPFQDSQDWILSSASFGFFYFFLLCLRVCLYIYRSDETSAFKFFMIFCNVVFTHIKPWADGLLF